MPEEVELCHQGVRWRITEIGDATQVRLEGIDELHPD